MTPERGPRLVPGSMATLRRRPGPAAVGVLSMLCLLIGLLYLAMQCRAVFSDQLKEEYASLVLDAAARAEAAREQLRVLQQLPVGAAIDPDSAQRARAELTRRIESLAALVNASPTPAPYIAPALLSANASLAETDLMLDNVFAYWHAQRDRVGADLRTRIARAGRTLIALAALLFCLLVTALGMYARRAQQLAGQSDQFEFASLHDSMTGLPNRRKLLAALEEAANPPDPEEPPARDANGALAQAADARRCIAVFYIDLDGFKQVNDSRGHHVGDEFLIAVSARFREAVRKADVVARIGGDEFAVLVSGYSTNAELAEIARRLIACVVHTDERMGLGIVRASIGIASYPDPIDDYRRLVAAADDAMYQVKRGGKNGYAFVGPGNLRAVS